MEEGRASLTAEYMALFRALESARPAGRRLFHDPFAHVGAADYRARYFGPAAEGMRGYEFYRIAVARRSA